MTKHSENIEPSNSTKPVLANRLLRFKGRDFYSGETVYGTGLFNDGFNLWLCDLEDGKTFSELTTHIIKQDSAELLTDSL